MMFSEKRVETKVGLSVETKGALFRDHEVAKSRIPLWRLARVKLLSRTKRTEQLVTTTS